MIVFLALLLIAGHAHAQESATATGKAAKVKKLYDAHRWEAVVHAVPESPTVPADLELDRGLALAKLGRMQEARRAFQAGLAGHPRDPRFLVEMAGIDYQQKRFAAAKSELRRALALDPSDRYANDFLASIYFLEGNLEAALKYWNRIGQPKLNDLSYQAPPKLDRALLDRAFEFTRGGEWRRSQFLKTQARLESLDIFSQMRFDLAAQPQGGFDLGFYSAERGFQGGRFDWIRIASMLRGLPYESVYPEFYDLNGKALNWLSFFRWDKNKRRLSSMVETPLFANPKYRVRFGFDGRNENWNLTRTLLPNSPSPSGMNMETAEAMAVFQSIENGRWQWSLGADYTYRRFRNLVGIPSGAQPFFTDTSGIALRLGARRSLIRYPERRFTLDSRASAEFGKFYSALLDRYGQVRGELDANWFPKARGEDDQLQTTLRAARTFGDVPFDDLFTLGVDRDNDLWMRGHSALIGGKKGNSPLGRNFILSNSEFDKIVYRNAFVTLKLGPFLDTGDIYDPSGYFGSPKWLTDTGLQARVVLLGSFQFVLGYGRNLRDGGGTFYTTVSGRGLGQGATDLH